MVPYADWNTLRYEDKEQAMEKMLDLTMITDILPTGYHGCIEAGVGSGSTVYIGGGGPVGLAAATSAFFLGAAAVIVGDPNKERREHAHSIGCETLDPLAGSLPDSTRYGTVSPRFGIGWAKSLTFATGQTPTMRYNRKLREAILHDRLPIGRKRQRDSDPPR